MGAAGRPWVGAILIVKMKDWSWEMKKREKEMEGERESKTLTREKSHSNEIGSIWKVCFSGTQMHISWLATSYNGPSEWDRASMRGRETAKPHKRRLRLHLSFEYCNSQSSKSLSLKLSNLFLWPIVRFLSAPFCFNRKRIIPHSERNLWVLKGSSCRGCSSSL